MVTYIILGGFLEKIEYNRPQNPILILKAATLTPPPHTPPSVFCSFGRGA